MSWCLINGMTTSLRTKPTARRTVPQTSFTADDLTKVGLSSTRQNNHVDTNSGGNGVDHTGSGVACATRQASPEQEESPLTELSDSEEDIQTAGSRTASVYADIHALDYERETTAAPSPPPTHSDGEDDEQTYIRESTLVPDLAPEDDDSRARRKLNLPPLDVAPLAAAEVHAMSLESSLTPLSDDDNDSVAADTYTDAESRINDRPRTPPSEPAPATPQTNGHSDRSPPKKRLRAHTYASQNNSPGTRPSSIRIYNDSSPLALPHKEPGSVPPSAQPHKSHFTDQGVTPAEEHAPEPPVNSRTEAEDQQEHEAIMALPAVLESADDLNDGTDDSTEGGDTISDVEEEFEQAVDAIAAGDLTGWNHAKGGGPCLFTGCDSVFADFRGRTRHMDAMHKGVFRVTGFFRCPAAACRKHFSRWDMMLRHGKESRGACHDAFLGADYRERCCVEGVLLHPWLYDVTHLQQPNLYDRVRVMFRNAIWPKEDSPLSDEQWRDFCRLPPEKLKDWHPVHIKKYASDARR